MAFYKQDGFKFMITNNEAKVIRYTSLESKNEIVIPSEINNFPVTSVGAGAFKDVDHGTRIKIPDSVTDIAAAAFEECDIEEIVLSKNVEKINDHTFRNCHELKYVELPQELKYIGSEAFSGCSALQEIIIPDGVYYIEGGAITDCDLIKNIHLPSELIYLDNVIQNCKSLEEIEIPNKVQFLSGFGGCRSLKNIIIPDSVKTIGEGTFASCIALKEISLPENLELIGKNAFRESGIERINIPSNVTTIKQDSFRQCIALGNVFVPDNIAEIESGVFLNCPKLILCVNGESPAYDYAIDNNIPYFLLPRTDNPYTANGQSVSGTVTTVRGEPVSRASVEFIDKYGNVRETVETDENGAYTFTYAEVGAYAIRAEDNTGRTGSDNFSIRRKNVFETYLLGNTDITVLDYVAVTGAVTNERGAAISNAEVSLIDETGMALETVQTDEDGKYTFPHVTNGSYTIRADKDDNTSIEPITVYAGDDEVNEIECNIVIRQGAAVSGSVIDTEGNPVVWAEIIVTDTDGERVASLYTDKDGSYEIDSLPLGIYSITAVFEDINTKLVGVASVDIISTESVTADTITAVAEKTSIGTATISGKVTAHGQKQISSVILRDVFLNEIAVCHTSENGKYKFTNIADGVYTIIATTQSDGAGFTSVVIKDGELESGNTSITVYKTGTVDDFETQVAILPEVNADTSIIKSYESSIIKANNAYNSLSQKDKKRVLDGVVDKLNGLIEILISSVIEINDTGAEAYETEVKGLETVISDEEIKSESEAQVSLDIAVIDTENIEDEATVESVLQLDEKAENEEMTVVEYFDIDLTKSTEDAEKEIKNITKDSVGTGKVQITMTIPEEEKGHENYTMLHLHNGEVTTLVDIDNDPDTVTFETDKFSQFALAYDDNVRAESNNIEASVVYDSVNNAVNITSDQTVKNVQVVFAAYAGGCLKSLQIKTVDLAEGINEPISADNFDTTGTDGVKVMVWYNLRKMTPVFVD